MARSRRRARRVSRILVPALAVAGALIAAYLLWPAGAPATAEAGGASSSPAPAGPARGTTLGAPRRDASVSAVSGVKSTGAPPSTQPGRKPDAKPGEAQQASSSLTPPLAATQPAVAVSAAFLTDAKALLDQGKLLEARKVLNDALQTGRLDAATAEQAKARIRELNQAIIFTPTRRFADDPQQGAHTVAPGDNLTKICRNLPVPPNFIARVNAVKPERIREGQSLKLITVPVHAVVNKKTFTMDVYLGDLPGKPGSMYLATYKVGLGEDGSTPTGLWEVTKNSKTVNPAWTNPRTNETFAPDDPKNPLGERWIGLTGIAGEAVGAVSYGIHGTIEPESIGTNGSMGCIRLKHEDVVELYDMLSEGRSTVLVVAQ